MPKRLPTGRKVGRPTKLTDEVRKKIIGALQVGATHRIAASFVGVDLSTFQDWLAKIPEFADACRSAESSGSLSCLSSIRTAATSGVWQAGAWLLERRHPDEYGRRQVEVVGRDGGAVQIAAQIVVVPARAASVADWQASVQAGDIVPPQLGDDDSDA